MDPVLPPAPRGTAIPAHYREVPYAPNPPGPYVDQTDAAQETPSLIEYWRIIRRRKGPIVILAFVGAVLGLLITVPQTPVYQAKAVLEIQDINQDFLNMKQVTPEAQTYNALTDVQTQIKILQSETIKDRTIARLKPAVAGTAKPAGSRVSSWRSALNLPEPEDLDPREAMLKDMARHMAVRAAGQTRIIEVLVDSTDKELAANFANTAVNEYIDQNMEARWKMSQRTGDWLSRQLDDMRIKLERSEDALQAYARQAGLVFMGGGGSTDDKYDRRTNISEEKLRQVQQSLSAASADRVAKQSRYEMAKNSAPETLPDVLNDSTLRDYQKNLTDLRRQLAEASSTYTAEYPKVKRLQAQVQTLETALERERAAIIQRIKNDYEEALRREKLLTADYGSQARTVTGEGERAIQYNILKREVDSNRQLYDAMLQKLKESSLAAALKASNIRIVDNATPPKRPYKPSTPLNTGFGFFAGLFAGVAFVIVRERSDRTLQSPGDAPYWLNVPELGVIPSARAEVRGRLSYYGKKHKENEARPTAGSELRDRIELVTYQRKPSVISEAFRAALTSILFNGQDGSRPRVLVLTSSNPSEGKTTVVSNLAIALAEIRYRVLLIDADLRKPRIHDIFQVDNERGLSDALRGGGSDLGGIVQETEIPGLFVLPSGPSTSTAANLLFAGQMHDVLSRFRQDFDMILIDTPPMLQMPDARVVGRMADGVILVTRANHTTRDAATAARQRFAEDNIRVLGTILNDWDPKESSAGYYGYYKGSQYGGYSSYSARSN